MPITANIIQMAKHTVKAIVLPASTDHRLPRFTAMRLRCVEDSLGAPPTADLI
jgi:hypothetical protein